MEHLVALDWTVGLTGEKKRSRGAGRTARGFSCTRLTSMDVRECSRC